MGLKRGRKHPSRAAQEAAAGAVRAWADGARTQLLSKLSSLDGAERARAVGGADALEVFAHEEPPARATFGPTSVDPAWRDAYREGYLEAFELVEAKRYEFVAS